MYRILDTQTTTLCNNSRREKILTPYHSFHLHCEAFISSLLHRWTPETVHSTLQCYHSVFRMISFYRPIFFKHWFLKLKILSLLLRIVCLLFLLCCFEQDINNTRVPVPMCFYLDCWFLLLQIICQLFSSHLSLFIVRELALARHAVLTQENQFPESLL